MEVAELGFEVNSDDIRRADKSLSGFTRTTKKAESATERANRDLDRQAGRMDAVRGGASKAARVVGVLAGALLSVQAASATIDVAKGFERQASQLSAITGATGEQLQFLKTEARDIAKVTTQTASQVIEAFQLIASGKPELLTASAALADVTEKAITLSEAAGIDVPQAAVAMTASLNQFSAPAEEAARFMNVLAAGAQKGASLIPETSKALETAGVVASKANISFEQTNAAIQVLAANEIKAERAGTALRSVFARLQTQTENVFGDMADRYNPAVVGLDEALRNLQRANLSTVELTKLFGEEQFVAGQILIDNVDRVAELTKAITGTNTATEQASTNTDNLWGDMKELGSAVEAVQLEFTGNNGLRAAVQTTTSAFLALEENSRTVKEVLSTLAVFAGTTAVIRLGAMATAAGTGARLLGVLTAAAKTTGRALRFLVGGPLTAAISLLATGLFVWVRRASEAEAQHARTLEVTRKATKRLAEARGQSTQSALEEARATRQSTKAVIEELRAKTESFLAQARQLEASRPDVAAAIKEAAIETGNRIERLEGELADLDAEIRKGEKRLADWNKELKDSGDNLQDVGNNGGDASGELSDFDKEVNKLLRSIESINQTEFDRQLLRLNLALEEALREGHAERAERIERAMIRLSEANVDAAEETARLRDEADKTAPELDELGERSEGVAAIIERQWQRLDDTFVNFWRDILDGGKNAFDSLERLFKDTLAQILNAIVTSPIRNALGQMFQGLIPGGGGPMSRNSGLGGIIPSLTRRDPDFVGPTTPQHPGRQQLTGFGNAFAGAGTGFAVGSLVGDSTASTIGGVAGGAIGQVLTGTVFSQTFSAVLGGFAGPVGAIVGGLLGSFIGGLFSKAPRIKIGGEGAIPSGRKISFSNADAIAEGPFGRTAIQARKVGDEAAQNLAKAIEDLDQAVADVLPEGVRDAVVGAVSDDLARAFQRQKGEDINAEQLIENRFATIVRSIQDELGLATDEIETTFVRRGVELIVQTVQHSEGLLERFVLGFAGTIEEKVQRLGDVLAIAELQKTEDNLVTAAGNLEDVLVVLDDLGDEGERLAKTYQRVLTQAQTLDTAIERLGAQFSGSGEAMLRTADDLAARFGGAEGFGQAVQQLLQVLGKGGEDPVAKAKAAREAIRGFNDEMGLTGDEAITGRKGLERFVKGLDLTTDAGKDAFEAALRVAPAIATFEDFMERFEASVSNIQLFVDSNPLDRFLENSAQGAETMNQALARTRGEVLDAASAFDGSTASVAQLEDAVRRRFELELQLIRQINQAVEQSVSALEGTRENIASQLRSDRENFALKREEIRGLVQGISEIEDPAELQRVSERINQLAGEAFGLLSEEQKKVLGPEFLEFIDDVIARIEERGEKLTEDVVKDGEGLRKEVAANFGEAELEFATDVNKFSTSTTQFDGAVDKLVNQSAEQGKANVAAIRQAGEQQAAEIRQAGQEAAAAIQAAVSATTVVVDSGGSEVNS